MQTIHHIEVGSTVVIRAESTVRSADGPKPGAAVFGRVSGTCRAVGKNGAERDGFLVLRGDGWRGGGPDGEWICFPEDIEPVSLSLGTKVRFRDKYGVLVGVSATERGDRYTVEYPDGGQDYGVHREHIEMVRDSTSASEEQVLAEATPDDSNPKDAVARLKVDLSLISPVAQAHIADALMDGAAKYGPYNWRDKKVQSRVYLAAAQRHLNQWAMGEETAEDSGVHHLGHAAACLVILLDAQAHECLLDNRAKGLPLQQLHDVINNRRAGVAQPGECK